MTDCTKITLSGNTLFGVQRQVKYHGAVKKYNAHKIKSHNSTTASQEEKKSDSENDDYVNPAYKRRKKRNLAKKRLLRTGIAAYREPGTILDPAE